MNKNLIAAKLIITLSISIYSSNLLASISADYPKPVYCSSSKLTPTELMVCGDPALSKLFLELSDIILELSDIIEDEEFNSDCEPTKAADEATKANTD